jgi:hypothetical protein
MSAITAAAARPVRPGGIGVGIGINIPAVSMFQCPSTICNQGLAYRGNDIADVCYLPIDGWGGGYWNLLLDHNNNEMGFTAARWLTGSLTGQQCGNIGIGTTPVPGSVTLYQCPSTICNQGQAYRGNDVADICWLQGTAWDLYLNHNLNEVGFAYWDQFSDSQLTTC